MIRRVSLLFAMTGFGQVVTILGLKYLASTGQWDDVAQIGAIETLIQTLVYVIGFGIQTEAIRSTAFSSDWRSKLDEVQTARVTLGLLCLPLTGLVALDWTYAALVAAPVLGLSCDYALYSRGMPVAGAAVAFFRAVVPIASAMILTYFNGPFVPEGYLVSFVLTYLFTNFLIAVRLKIPAWWNPSLKSLALFVKTLPVGMINLGLFYFGLGILIFAKYVVSVEALAVAFMMMKFYTIYKGAIRVVHQGFINQMKDPRVCLQVDQLSVLFALAVVASVFFFPSTFIGLFFGTTLSSQRLLFIMLGVSVFVYSIFASVFTRALLEKRDAGFLQITGIAVAASLLALWITSSRFDGGQAVLLSVLIGEIVLSSGFIWLFLPAGETGKRLLFVGKVSPALLIPFLAEYYFGESLITYVVTLVLMGLVLLILNYRTLTWRKTESPNP